MMQLLPWLGGLLLLSALVASCLLVLLAWRARLHRRHDRLVLLYLRSLMARCMGRRRYAFPFLHLPGARMALVEAVARLRALAIDCNPMVLRSVVRAYDLERLLLRRLWRPLVREESLRLLALLPVSQTTARRLAMLPPPRSRRVRFALLMARLNASPREALPLLRAFPDDLTPFECRTLVAMVVRGSFCPGYRELLEASEPNLWRLGLRLVRHFGLVQALPLVGRLAGRWEVASEALRTLCDLGLPLMAPSPLLSEAERRSLLRRAAQAGYALQGVERLLRGEEHIWFEQLAATYKSVELWS